MSDSETVSTGRLYKKASFQKGKVSIIMGDVEHIVSVESAQVLFDELKEALRESHKGDCACKGFYQPQHCPVHGKP